MEIWRHLASCMANGTYGAYWLAPGIERNALRNTFAALFLGTRPRRHAASASILINPAGETAIIGPSGAVRTLVELPTCDLLIFMVEAAGFENPPAICTGLQVQLCSMYTATGDPSACLNTLP